MKQVKIVCPKCQGTGYIDQYKHIDSGICFECMGTGYIINKQYTEQEQKKRETKIQNRHWATLEELRGFKNTNILYIVEGNTYNIKDELKTAGAKWNMFFRAWTFENDNLKDKYNLKSVKFEETLKEGDI